MRKRIVWIVSLLFLLVISWHYVRQADRAGPESEEAGSVTTSLAAGNLPSVDVQQAVREQLSERTRPPADATSVFRSIFSAPLSLYGKVIDQDGQPVEGASVRIGVADKPWDSGSSHQRTTGLDGLFEITGINGAGVFVGVEKDGYYAGKESRRLLQSGEMPTKDAPAIWKLQRIGQADPLILQPYVWIVMPMDGTPVEYDFGTGKFVSAGKGQLRVEVEVEDSKQQRFSWRYRISLPSGGLARRAHEFEFIAPENGYIETLEGRVNADDMDWRASFGGDFFARLPDGRYARFVCSLGGGKRGFEYRIAYAAINSAGTRGLELDPRKVRSFEP